MKNDNHQKDKNNTALISGKELRALNSIKRKSKFKLKNLADNLLTEELSILSGHQYDPTQYKLELNHILLKLRKHLNSTSDYTKAVCEVSIIIEKFNAKHDLSLPLPPPVIQIKRPPTSRDQYWFKRSSITANIGLKLENWFSDNNTINELCTEDVILLTILSTMYSGGLCDAEALTELAKALVGFSSNASPILNKYIVNDKELYYIELQYKSMTVNNVRKEETELRDFRWYVDSKSLALINHLANKERQDIDWRKIDQDQLFFKLRKFLKKKVTFSNKISSLKYLCDGASSFYWNRTSPYLPISLVEVATGKTTSASLSPSFWKDINKRAYNPIGQIKFGNYKSIYSLSKTGIQNKQKGNNKSKTNLAYSALKEILSPFGRQKTVRHLSSVIRELNSCETTNWPAAGLILKDWYLELAFSKSIKSVKTLSDYHSNIATYWFNFWEEYSPFDMDSEEIHTVLSSYITEQPKKHAKKITKKSTKKNKKKRINERTEERHASLLDRLYESAVKNYGIPAKERSLANNERIVPFVDSGYISYSLYQNLLSCIEKIEGIDHSTIHGLKILIIMAYRTGCRISELLSIHLNEIEPSEETFVFIKSNIHGTGKSNASKRKLPLKYLLTEKEFEAFQSWLSSRKLLSTSDKELLFCSAVNGMRKFDPLTISRLFSELLRQLTGNNNYTFHHFRHTCISNMQIIINQEWMLANTFCGMKQCQLKKLYENVFGNPKLDICANSMLASFAGHNGPKTSFTSYMHFSDLLIRMKLEQSTATITRKTAKVLYMLPEFKLKTLRKKNGHDIDKIPQTLIYKEFCKKHQNSLPIIHDVKQNPAIITVDSSPSNLSWTYIPQHFDAFKVLKHLEKGESTQEVSYRFNISETRINYWIKNANALSTLKTRQGGSRTIDSKRKTRAVNDIFTPSLPQSSSERQQVATIIKMLRVTFKDRKAEIINEIKYYFKNTTISRSGIAFQDKNRLALFLSTFSEAIPISSWNLEITCNDAINTLALRKHWLVKSNLKIVFNSSKSKVINSSKVYLHLKHPEMDSIMKNQANTQPSDRLILTKFSSSALRYIFFMIATMQFTDQDFEEMNGERKESA
ncbi:MAG: hypothetical protein COB38_12075 [Gammaproteobacteria bacterium]|nr:MAG: hypothetical protein COB38_12075 [Gammaproteobacteria bacterium]